MIGKEAVRNDIYYWRYTRVIRKNFFNEGFSGTKGYAYVPAPWWLTDYFEFRYEDQNENKKFFYKWDGFGLRYEIQEFISSILNHRLSNSRLRRRESIQMAAVMQQFIERKNFMEI